MVKHIVLFQLKVELPAETRSKVATDFKGGIEKLPAVIPFIRQIEVGFNINSDETWDICLNATFDTFDDVRATAVWLETLPLRTQLCRLHSLMKKEKSRPIL